MAEHYVYKGRASHFLPNRATKTLLLSAILVSVQGMPCAKVMPVLQMLIIHPSLSRAENTLKRHTFFFFFFQFYFTNVKL